MMNPDETIKTFDQLKPVNESDMLAIIRHVTQRLEEFLGSSLSCDDYSEDLRPDFFRIWVYSDSWIGGQGFKLTWRGIVYGSTSENSKGLFVGATMFLYSHGKKLVTSNGESFLDLTYTVDGSGKDGWGFENWQPDEYGEYTQFDSDLKR